MKTYSSTLKQAILDGTIAFTVELVGKYGDTYYFTTHDKEVSIGGNVYSPAPGLVNLKYNSRTTSEVSNQKIQGGWLEITEDDLNSGKMDNSDVVYRIFNWVDPTDNAIIFNGKLGLVSWTKEGFVADLQNHARDFKKRIGIISTAGCRHNLFSQNTSIKVGACTLNEASYTYTSEVTSIINGQVRFGIQTTGTANDWFNGGKLTWTSGLNDGISTEVKLNESDEIELYLPSVYIISVGDTFTVTTGCDKKFSTCGSKFNNVVNFGGFPHITNEVNWK